MGWLEAKHRRSEEKAEVLQNAEIEKIIESRKNLYGRISELSYDKHNVSKDLIECSFLSLSEETDCSDYGTDTYQLAKENILSGRILKLDTISPSLIKKNKLYEHLANMPASSIFTNAINYSLSLRKTIKIHEKYEYKSCIIYPLNSVNVTLRHRDTGNISNRNENIMPDGLSANISLDFNIISEMDFHDIRILFLLAPGLY